MLARRLALQCVQAGMGRRVRVQLDYHPNSSRPESVAIWADDQPVGLPRGIVAVPTLAAAQAMLAGLSRQDFAPLLKGSFARWGHFGRSGPWWEYEVAPAAGKAAA